jgi:TRAP-type transport system periplasmic protein
MKKLPIILGIIFITVCLVLPGCSPSTTSTTANHSTSTPETTSKVIELRWSSSVQPQTIHHQGIVIPLVEQIEKRTAAIDKPVKISLFPGGALGPESDQYALLTSGTVDIVNNWGPVSVPGRFPLLDCLNLPFVFPSASVYVKVAQELFESNPAIQEEVEEAKLLYFQPTPVAYIQSRVKPIKTLDDLKGLRILSRGGVNSETIERLGSVPVIMPMPEVYNSLERGLLDVAPMNWEGTVAFRWYEVTNYRTDLPKGMFLSTLACSMNWDTWNSLPLEVQQIFDELTGSNSTEWIGSVLDETNAAHKQVLVEYDRKAGNPAIETLSDDEFQKWVEAVTPIYEKYIADGEAKGLPTRALFNDMINLVKKYSE